MNEFVLNGLVQRRAQLAGDIENTHDAQALEAAQAFARTELDKMQD